MTSTKSECSTVGTSSKSCTDHKKPPLDFSFKDLTSVADCLKELPRDSQLRTANESKRDDSKMSRNASDVSNNTTVKTGTKPQLKPEPSPELWRGGRGAGRHAPWPK